MKQSPETSTTGLPRKAAILLLATIADTTWRAFGPTIGGTFLGVWLDNTFDVAPAMTIIFVAAGFALSALLITLQIRSVRRSK